ncbi:MAG: type II and III secretion system protein family protein [Candidatus Sedimenticola sp. (ex Thyasira tokunagai)]
MKRLFTPLLRIAPYLAIALFLSLLLPATSVTAADPASIPVRMDLGGRIDELNIAVGKSRILVSPVNVKQLLVGNPDVADIRLLGKREILLLGKSPGTTNLAIRDNKERLVSLIDVAVGYDLEAIKRKLYEVLPQEEQIEVRAANGTVILSGQVSSLAAMNAAQSIANSYLPGKSGQVLNQLEVGGAQQVMLEVTISEISRSVTKELGMGLNATPSKLTLLTTPVFRLSPFGALTLALGDLTATLSALEDQGLANILAEPKITALSGQEANFLAGGEFAVPVAGDEGSIDIEFKEFGVAVRFTPTVLSSDRINLKLATEVSAIDRTLGATSGGVSVPGLKTRKSATTIELGDGEGFMIAGLLQKDMNNAVDQFPGLGDIPVLGTLFRSTDFQRNETELVISVTPRLVKPVPSGSIKYPTDNLIPPSDVDQYMEGKLEGSVEQTQEQGNKGGIDGSYGHQL